MNTLTILGTSLLLAVFVLAGRGGGAIGQPPGPPAQAWQDALSPAWTPTPDSPAPTPTPPCSSVDRATASYAGGRGFDSSQGGHCLYAETSSVQTATSSVTVPPRGSIEALICDRAWPCSEALAVAWCESRYDPLAYNVSGASGVFQLLMPLHEARLNGGDVFDAETNIAAAFGLWNETRDWRHWRECR